MSTIGSGRIDATSSGSGEGSDPPSPTTMPEPNVRVSMAKTVDVPGRGRPVPSAITSRSTPVSWSAISSAEAKRSTGSWWVARLRTR